MTFSSRNHSNIKHHFETFQKPNSREWVGKSWSDWQSRIFETYQGNTSHKKLGHCLFTPLFKSSFALISTFLFKLHYNRSPVHYVTSAQSIMPQNEGGKLMQWTSCQQYNRHKRELKKQIVIHSFLCLKINMKCC